MAVAIKIPGGVYSSSLYRIKYDLRINHFTYGSGTQLTFFYVGASSSGNAWGERYIYTNVENGIMTVDCVVNTSTSGWSVGVDAYIWLLAVEGTGANIFVNIDIFNIEITRLTDDYISNGTLQVDFGFFNGTEEQAITDTITVPENTANRQFIRHLSIKNSNAKFSVVPKWTSSNDEIISVSDIYNGHVAIRGNGTVTISLIIPGLSAVLKTFTLVASWIPAPSAEPETRPGYINERDKYFYGVQESMQVSFTQDPMSDPEMTAELAGAMGFSSYRFRMEITEIVQGNASNVVSLIPEKVTEFRGYLTLLAQNGITNYLTQSTYFVLPYGFSYDNSKITYPRPGTAYYTTFMNNVEQSYYLASQAFPEIRYWQAGNEMNADHFCNPPSGAAYTLSEKAQIGTDLMFYARKGLKRGNPDAMLVTHGPAMNIEPNLFMTMIYENILSGNYPSNHAAAGISPSADTDEYFDALSWHPYNFSSGGDTSEFSQYIQDQKRFYQIAQDHGDDGKKVIFTEYGFTTTWNPSKTPAELEAEYQYALKEALINIYAYLPFVETVHIFRMFDWEEARTKLVNADMEAGFGLFTTPGVSEKLQPRPKAMTLELFKLINGDDADNSALFKDYTTR